jgi:hypothetical protein
VVPVGCAVDAVGCEVKMLPHPLPKELFRLGLTEKVREACHSGNAEIRERTDAARRVVERATTVLAALSEALVLACRGEEDRLDALWHVARGQVGWNALATAAPRAQTEPNELEALFERIVSRLPGLRKSSPGFEELVDIALRMIAAESTGLPRAARPPDVLTTSDRAEAVMQHIEWSATINIARSAVLAALTTERKRADDRAVVRACFRALGYEKQLGKRQDAKAHRAAKKAVTKRRADALAKKK